MIPGEFFDLRSWVESFWIPGVLLIVSGVIATVWRWWTNNRVERHKADAEARKVASREFAKAATQIGSLRMYEFGGGLADDAELAKKQDVCLEKLLHIAHGSVATVARNAGDATLPRLGVTAASVAVGNLDQFAKAYKLAQLEYLHEVTTEKPESRLRLSTWANTYRFASRVLDPHRPGPVLGYLRLAWKSTYRIDDLIRAQGQTPKRVSVLRRIRWIFAA